MIEYLELASSFDEQTGYETLAPSYVNVPYEIIEQFADWSLHLSTVPGSSRTYSDGELAALSAYRVAWDAAAEAIGDHCPSVLEVQAVAAWRLMTEEAGEALRVFATRGRLHEDEEAGD